MHKMIFFGDSNSTISSLLLEKALELMLSREDFHLAAVCDASSSAPRSALLRTTEQLLSYYLRRWFNATSRRSGELLLLPRLEQLCHNYRIPLLHPPENDINHPEFVTMLQNDFAPDWGFSCYCTQIFGSHLLGVFDSAINYHNGLLPKYRGLRATAWSMYNREEETGFTFHYMTERIDDGGVLLHSSIPVTPGSSFRELEVNKALLARSSLDQVLDKLSSHEEGVKPRGKDNYFSRKAWKELITIDDPGEIAARELVHRLRCFEILRIRIEDQYYPVTDVVELSAMKRFAFRTQEGIIMAPKRFLYLPYPLFKLFRRIRPDQT